MVRSDRRAARATFLLSCVLLLAAASWCQAATIYVCASASGPAHDGTSWATAFTGVQQGIDAAVAGDEVWVCAAVYAERITLKEGVGVYGGFAGDESTREARDWRAHETVLDGDRGGSVVTALNLGPAPSAIDGFTIRNGNGSYGGGIHCEQASPTIAHNVISGNGSSYEGGGIYCENASPTITNNTITANSAQWGGGIWCRYSTAGLIVENEITENTADYGGGIMVGPGTPLIARCTLKANSASSHGGGMNIASSAPVIVSTIVTENTAGRGGGVFYHDSTGTLANSTIVGNTASTGGGVEHEVESTPTIANTIVAFNSSGIHVTSGTPALRYNCVYGNGGADYVGVSDPGWADGNVPSDPLLANLEAGDFHLSALSPCIDAGDDGGEIGALLGSLDIDGEARIQGLRVDIGADESPLSSGFYVGEVTVSSAGQASAVSFAVVGAQFEDGAVVTLVKSDDPSVVLTTVVPATFVNDRQLQVSFDLRLAPPGVYDVVVQNPGGATAVLPGGFTVVSGGEAQFWARVVIPLTVRPGRDYTGWLEYGNGGQLDMLAPLVVLSSPQDVLMRLSPAEPLSPGPLQVVAVNSAPPAGVLGPGASCRLPFYFRAPGSGSGERFGFEAAVLKADDTPVDWADIEPEVRPDDVPGDAWAAIWANLTNQLGATWEEYLQVLDADATYLAGRGSSTHDVRKLFGFETGKAAGALSPRPALAAAVDASSPGRVLPLAFVRVAPTSIAERFRLGPLGRGWAHNFEYRLERPDERQAIIRGPAGSARAFTRYAGGGWQAEPGDSGVLSEPGDGSYLLREKDGLMLRFSASGVLTQLAEPNGNSLALTYDGSGRLTEVLHTNGERLALSYDGSGRVTRVIDPYGGFVDYGYEGEYLRSVTLPGGQETWYEYVTPSGGASDHALRTITFPDGTHRYYAYDAQGRLAEESRDGGAEPVTYTYLTPGGVVVTDALGAASTLDLGASGELLAALDPLDDQSAFQYDEDLNLTRLTDAEGGVSTIAYDSRGNAREISDQLGQVIPMGHTAEFSGLEWLRDPNGNLTGFASDGNGNLTAITYPDAAEESFTYDALGNLVSYTNRRGQTVTYGYDVPTLSRMTRKSIPAEGRTVDYGYDGRGNLTTVADSLTGTISMQYDPRDFLTGIEYPNGRWFSFSYDDAGKRTRREGDDGYVLDYAYDAAGRLASITDGTGALVVGYEYDDVGRLGREVKGNGTSTTYSYDPAGQVLSVVNYAPDGLTVQSSFDYSYDPNGNPTAMTTLAGATSYGYDATGQLTSASYPDGRVVTYDYDPAGNRITVTDDDLVIPYTTNELNQYTQVGGVTYSYDLDGNLVSRTDLAGTTGYEYDVENRLVRVVTPADGTWEYTYDALGNRIAVTHDGSTTWYLHDPVGLVDVAAEYDTGGSLVARYVHALGLAARVDAMGEPAYYAFDAIGHTRQMTDAAGALANDYDYDPFGIPLLTDETIPNSFEYTGRWGVTTEGNGLTYMRARYYDARIGRFAGADPTGVAAGTNLYSYVESGPLGAVDPAGLRPAWYEYILAYLIQYGNWGGPNWSGGKPTGAGELGDRSVPYADWLDKWWKYHDIECIDHPEGATARTKRGLLAELQWRDAHGMPVSLHQRVAAWAFLAFGFGGLPEAAPANGPTAPLSSSTSQTAIPVDPNEKVGPEGAGVERFIPGDRGISYVIYFENQGEVAVQELGVTDYLDVSLDWTAFDLGEVAFGSQVVALSGSSDAREAPLEGSEYLVTVEAGIDPGSGRASWVLRCIDPLTGEMPADALAGFLPPNDETGRGEGHLTFTVRPKAGVATGTEIWNQATIDFEIGVPPEPITTAAIFNTIDSGPPGSHVLPLPAASQTSFLVSWAGTDDLGSEGLRYTIYAADSGGLYTPWLSDTADTFATFTGVLGHTYDFYSVATDPAGNTEATPFAPDATTTIAPAIAWTLTVAADPAEGGAVSGGGVYDDGALAHVAATANPGWGFTEWIGPAADAAMSSTTVLMDADKSVTAHFSALSYTLSVSGAGGSVTVDGELYALPWSGQFAYDAAVTLQAVAGGDMRFDGWTGDLESEENPLALRMNRSWDLTVVFSSIEVFSDVDASFWAAREIAACAHAGIVQGYWDNTYHPERAVTRDQMAVYIARALAGSDDNVQVPTGVVSPSFTDVGGDHWAYRHVEYCAGADIVQGYPGGAYHPDEVVNRGQMAVYIARAMVTPSGDAGLPDPPSGAPTFTDVTAGNGWSWCYRHVEYCYVQGVVQGYWDGTYHPEREVTRDQMAVYVARAFELPM